MPATYSHPPSIAASSPPSPTALITALLSTLASISASTSPHPIPSAPSTYTSTAAFPSNSHSAQVLPESTRPLLLTLHVLFPHALLDALDLLDRGLVVKLVVSGDDAGDGGDAETSEMEKGVTMTKWRVLSSQTGVGGEYRNGDYYARQRQRRDWNASGSSGHGNGDGSGDRGTSSGRWREQRHDYDTQQRRRYDDEHDDSMETQNSRLDLEIDMGMATTYTVALNAWNCSCPAFAFAAFTGGGGGSGAASSLFGNSTTAMTRDRDEGRGNAQSELNHNLAVDMDMDMNMDVDTDPTTDLHRAPIPALRTADWTRKEALWQRLHQQQEGYSTANPILPFGGLAVPPTSTPATPAISNVNPLGAAQGSVTAPLPPAPVSTSESQALPPTCKHLLAALLASICPNLFGPHLQSRSGDGGSGMGIGRRGVVLRELKGEAEAAGWAS